jgi:hypothetical protein
MQNPINAILIEKFTNLQMNRSHMYNKCQRQSCNHKHNVIAVNLKLNKKNLRLKTNNKSTGEAQYSANYLKSQTDYTTKCQLEEEFTFEN